MLPLWNTRLNGEMGAHLTWKWNPWKYFFCLFVYGIVLKSPTSGHKGTNVNEAQEVPEEYKGVGWVWKYTGLRKPYLGPGSCQYDFPVKHSGILKAENWERRLLQSFLDRGYNIHAI